MSTSINQSEMLDVLDENGIPTGEVLPRDVVHKRGLWHESTLVCVINSKNEILMQKRSVHKDKYPGCWDLSVAGHLEMGSFSMDTLFAEMMEEIGIVLPQQIRVRDLKHLKTFRDQRIINDDFIENQFYNLYVSHVDVDVDVDNIQFQEDEVAEVKWLSIYEVKKLAGSGLCHPRTVWIDMVYKYISRLAFR